MQETFVVAQILRFGHFEINVVITSQDVLGRSPLNDQTIPRCIIQMDAPSPFPPHRPARTPRRAQTATWCRRLRLDTGRSGILGESVCTYISGGYLYAYIAAAHDFIGRPLANDSSSFLLLLLLLFPPLPHHMPPSNNTETMPAYDTHLNGGGAEAHHLEQEPQGACRHALPDPADHPARDHHELALGWMEGGGEDGRQYNIYKQIWWFKSISHPPTHPPFHSLYNNMPITHLDIPLLVPQRLALAPCCRATTPAPRQQ